ncbi:pimeloyl-ACP methyl ester carboxylesterase [Nocardia pseudobrasiliensis]|uniref:Pimeloyl-ACP methyl ester carboxylesterase n=2 Tax=Nocardia pseudobrasiliensis TaxID=45979 RepID=A0A370IEU5_9NOCA|nr:pimeloyl-ACP methyl ester carboxylesterase [Nocardia pseudobrasiliensis]
MLHSIGMNRFPRGRARLSIVVTAFALLVGFVAAQGCSTRTEPSPPVWQTLPALGATPAGGHSGYAAVDGIEMYYADYGQGRPVLLLHGGLGSGEYWNYQVPALVRAGYRVIVADSRGHGRSTRTAEPYSYDLMSADVLALLDQLGLSRVDLVGWSDGGIIGLNLAINHPERLGKVFAYGANSDLSGLIPHGTDNPNFVRYIDRARTEYQRLSPTPDQYDGFVAQITHMWETQPNYTAAQLSAITVPITIADGEYDEAIERSHTEYLARTIPHAQLRILPNVSHFGMLQNPDEFNRAVLDSLTRP